MTGVCELVRQIFRMHGHESETLHCQIPERGFELTREVDDDRRRVQNNSPETGPVLLRIAPGRNSSK